MLLLFTTQDELYNVNDVDLSLKAILENSHGYLDVLP